MKTLFYCQHSIGIGHLMRTIRLADASLRWGPVRVLCGGELPATLSVDSRIGFDSLPALSVDSDHNLIDPLSENDVDAIFRERAAMADRIVRGFKPDALVIEMFPFGRKKFAEEIISIINAARNAGKPVVFSSVRDVLVTSRRDQARHDKRAVDWLNKYFDVLLIHSDPELIALGETFSTYDEIDIPIHYTGYISSSAAMNVPDRNQQIVVSAGGGRVGQRLVKTALNSSRAIKEGLGLDMLVITGPLGDARSKSSHSEAVAKTVKFINDLPQELAHSALSVSQCGYNTAVDVLQTGTRAVFVPFETPTEDEQLLRAKLLTGRGHSVLLRERQLTPKSLIAAVSNALTMKPSDKCSESINLAGAQRSCEVIREALSYA